MAVDLAVAQAGPAGLADLIEPAGEGGFVQVAGNTHVSLKVAQAGVVVAAQDIRKIAGVLKQVGGVLDQSALARLEPGLGGKRRAKATRRGPD